MAPLSAAVGPEDMPVLKARPPLTNRAVGEVEPAEKLFNTPLPVVPDPLEMDTPPPLLEAADDDPEASVSEPPFPVFPEPTVIDTAPPFPPVLVPEPM